MVETPCHGSATASSGTLCLGRIGVGVSTECELAGTDKTLDVIRLGLMALFSVVELSITKDTSRSSGARLRARPRHSAGCMLRSDMLSNLAVFACC